LARSLSFCSFFSGLELPGAKTLLTRWMNELRLSFIDPSRFGDGFVGVDGDEAVDLMGVLEVDAVSPSSEGYW